jgi:hypothetical protein
MNNTRKRNAVIEKPDLMTNILGEQDFSLKQRNPISIVPVIKV